MVALPTSHSLRGVRKAGAWLTDRLRAAADPDSLTPEFVTRLLLFRVVLLAFGLRLLDASLAAAFSGCHEPWGMSSRAALAALIVRPLLSLAGILWPLLSMSSYEQYFRPFQRLSVCTSATTHLVQSMAGVKWVQGATTQNLLFDVFLLIINQDPMEELLPQLAFVQLMYSIGLVLQQVLGGRSSLLSITTQYEFFVMVLLGVLGLHKLYCSIVGPRDKLGMMRRQLRSYGGIGRHLSQSKLQPQSPPHETSPWAPVWAAPTQWVNGLLGVGAGDAGAAGTDSPCVGRFGVEESRSRASGLEGAAGRAQGSGRGPALRSSSSRRLSSAYLWKFVVIKAMHGVHFYLWYAALASVGSATGGSGSSSGGSAAQGSFSAAAASAWAAAPRLPPPAPFPVGAAAGAASAGAAAGASFASSPSAVGAGGFPVYGSLPAWRALGLPSDCVPAAMQALAATGVALLWLAAMVAAFGGRTYAARTDLANWLMVAGCLSCRLGLLILNPHTDNKAVFHNLLLLAFSLLSHEEPPPLFVAQMGALTAAFRCLSIVLSRRVPLQPITLRELVFTGPEYYILLLGMVIIYPATRVGRYVCDDEHASESADNTVRRGSRSAIPDAAPAAAHYGSQAVAAGVSFNNRWGRRVSTMHGGSGALGAHQPLHAAVMQPGGVEALLRARFSQDAERAGSRAGKGGSEAAARPRWSFGDDPVVLSGGALGHAVARRKALERSLAQAGAFQAGIETRIHTILETRPSSCGPSSGPPSGTARDSVLPGVVTARVTAMPSLGASQGAEPAGMLDPRVSVEMGALVKALGVATEVGLDFPPAGGAAEPQTPKASVAEPRTHAAPAVAVEPRTPTMSTTAAALVSPRLMASPYASASVESRDRLSVSQSSVGGAGTLGGGPSPSPLTLSPPKGLGAQVAPLPRLQALRYASADASPSAKSGMVTPNRRSSASGVATPFGAASQRNCSANGSSSGTPCMATPHGSPTCSIGVAGPVRVPVRRTTSTLSTMAAELSQRNSNARQARFLAKDRMLLLLELPLCTFLASEPLAAASWTAQGLFAATPALLYWASCVVHCVFAALAPTLAMAHRTASWAVRLDTALLLLQLSRMMLGLTSGQLPPMRGLVLLCAKWGLVDLGDALFFRAFPHKVLLFFVIHCYQMQARNGGSWQWGTLALDALLFNLVPLAAFMIVKGVVMLGSSINARLTSTSVWVRNAAAVACIGGQGILALVIMLQSLPSLAEFQAQRWLQLGEWMQGLGFEALGAGALPTALTVLAIILLLCTVSSLQSVVFYAITHLGSPRHRWFVQSQAAVAGFVEALQQSPSGRTLDGVVDALKAASEPVFGTDLLVKLATLDTSADAGDASLVTLNILHWGYKHVKNALQHRTMPLATLASIHWAVTKPAIAMTNDLLSMGPDEAVFEDWELHHHTFGARCFLVVPLIYCGHTLGALVVMGLKPNSIDSWLRRLVVELGKQVSSALYTVACHQEMEADKRILADVYGTELVAEAIKRQARNRPDRTNTHPERLPSFPGHESSKASSQSGIGDELNGAEAHAAGMGAPGQAVLGRSSQSAPLVTLGSSSTGQHVLYKQWHPAVSVLFADIVGYTTLSKQLEPEEVMHMLHDLFCRFDALCTEHSVFKVETIGDCYMACTGLLVETDEHARQLVDFARSMVAAASTVTNPLGGNLQIRVGIHSGRVMSGIVGSVRARYCLFGDTVNTASRMESTGLPNTIQISDDTHQMLPTDYQAQFKQRGTIEVKGKGLMSTYLDERTSGDAQVEGPPGERL